jgi:hypothetical protein
VIDLVFLPADVVLFDMHAILPDRWGTSNHAPLVFFADGPDSQVPVTRWSLPRGSEEEEAYLKEASESLSALTARAVRDVQELDVVVGDIAAALALAWLNNAKESQLGKHSKGWWSPECSTTLARHQLSRDPEDWKSYRRVMRVAK